MKIKLLFGALLALVPLIACARTPSASCSFKVDVSATTKGAVVNVDASTCQASVPDFAALLRTDLGKKLPSGTSVAGVSIIGPVGGDNLRSLSSAWEDACLRGKRGPSSARSADFVVHYSKSELSKDVTKMLARYGANWELSAAENFYPVSIKPNSQVVSKRCKSALLLPVLWFSRKQKIK